MVSEIRHPWFNMPSAKRKHPSSESSSDNDEGSSAFYALADANPTKRQRCSVLENGLAHLAIHHNTIHSTEPTSSPTLPDPAVVELESILGARSASPMPVDGEPSQIILPGSVEEPVTPEFSGSPPVGEDYEDVKMRSRSWYEPEKDRIVITDLDDSSDDDTESNSTSEAHAITISNALLERIKNQPSFASVLPAKDKVSSALVLFRPIMAAPDLTDITFTVPSQNDDDAMDVEP